MLACRILHAFVVLLASIAHLVLHLVTAANELSLIRAKFLVLLQDWLRRQSLGLEQNLRL